MTKIDTLFMTKTAEKPYPFGATHTYITHIREYPPPRDSASRLSKVIDCHQVLNVGVVFA